MGRSYCLTSGIVFILVALMHGWRFALDLPMQIGAWSVPRSLSGLAALGAAVLAVWAFRSAKNKTAEVVYT